jgi:hypothetical protein
MSDMDITIKYEHFNGLNQNVLRLGNEVRELNEKLSQAKRVIDALREAGDEAWYCYRHREPLSEAFQEWSEVRDLNIK